MMKKQEEETPKQKRLWLMLAVASVSLAVMAAVLVLTGSRTGGSGTFAPPPFESEAVQGGPEVPENLGYSPLDIPGAYQAALCGKVVEQDGKADIWFTNSKENTVWLKLRVLDKEGRLLGETGLLKPGEYVQSVDLSKSSTALDDGMEIQLKVMAYEPDTYHSAGAVILNTTLEKQNSGR